jgi:hypothetical protein
MPNVRLSEHRAIPSIPDSLRSFKTLIHFARSANPFASFDDFFGSCDDLTRVARSMIPLASLARSITNSRTDNIWDRQVRSSPSPVNPCADLHVVLQTNEARKSRKSPLLTTHMSASLDSIPYHQQQDSTQLRNSEPGLKQYKNGTDLPLHASPK